MLNDCMEIKHCFALYNFILSNSIKIVVETGIKHGISSFTILSALPTDGILVSIEPDIIDMVKPFKKAKWLIAYGTSRERLEWIFKLFPKVDLFIHDSEHTYENMKFEYETAIPHCRFIASHDINCKGANSIWEETVSKYKLTELVKVAKFAIAKV